MQLNRILAFALAVVIGGCETRSPEEIDLLVAGGSVIDPASGAEGYPVDIAIDDGVIVASAKASRRSTPLRASSTSRASTSFPASLTCTSTSEAAASSRHRRRQRIVVSDRWTHEAALDDPFLRAGVTARTLASLEGWQSPMASVPAPVRARLWDEGLASIGSAHEAGVAIALGTDVGNPFVFPGYSVHLELELLVEAGLSPIEALVAATRRPAEMLGKEDEFGTIEAGKRADLVVLGRNPLEAIRHTRTLEVVISEGEVIDLDARESFDAVTGIRR